MNQSGKRFGRWALLAASLLAAYFLFGGVYGILARPSIELAGTAWSGMGHSARFEDEEKGFYDGEPFSYAEQGGAVKGSFDQTGEAIDFVTMSDSRLFCVTFRILMVEDSL